MADNRYLNVLIGEITNYFKNFDGRGPACVLEDEVKERSF